MKINETQASDTTDDTQDIDSSQNDDKQQDGRSAFSRALAKKQEAAQQESGGAKTAKKLEDTSDASQFGQLATRETLSQVAEPKQVESKHAVELPQQLQQLVREISVAAGKNQVQIEMNSNVLQGLNVRIERQNGALAIQFQTSSPEVTKLISNNLSALSQGLSDRGLNVADIRITESKEATSVFGTKKQSASTQARYQGGRR